MIQDRASHMALFYSLIKAGSFTATAELLKVSVSHVSKQLAVLEAQLNVKLIQRTTRSLTLTEAGETFMAHCEKVVNIVHEASNIMDEARDDISGKLRLGLSQSFGTLHIIPAIEKLRQQYPKLQVEIRLFDHKVNMLEENLDLWLTNVEHIPEGYVAQRLAITRFVLAASPDYLINHSLPHHPNELIHHNCLIYQSRQRDYSTWSFNKQSEGICITVAGNYRVDLAQAVRDAAVSGWGIAYLASYLLKDEFRKGKLIQLMPEWQANQHMPFYAVYPSRKHLPKKISAVIAFFKQHIGDDPYWDKALRPHVKL
ncbi:LysR family transcriptional regulator [Shewanella surugensis]|uniref:LysR family transcriptional regulator n=1 Tax=Shewanella surugensis TaxID=212020 RepID=A0ABT0LH13_9GAMM|nr:LysR family transcriptional regulator [Shewanella surugensis]MCL1126974.1 LysR family transcriptional regulator [Shewanella surugensis]